MEPFTEKDPVYQLLGKAKPVEPRGDFTQNVMRAIRQEEVKLSLWKRFFSSVDSLLFSRPITTKGLAACTLALLFASITLPSLWQGSNTDSSQLVQLTSEAPSNEKASHTSLEEFEQDDVETEWEKLQELDQLLAIQNTDSLTDSQIALLLY